MSLRSVGKISTGILRFAQNDKTKGSEGERVLRENLSDVLPSGSKEPPLPMPSDPVSPLRSNVDLRYPIGRFQVPGEILSDDRLLAIATLAELPSELRNVLRGLDGAQTETPYREGGWTVRQVTHHIADSHMNALIRVKLALTEEWPTIKPYDEAAWARLHDATGPIEWSLELIESLHARWVMLLQSMKAAEWQRGFVHPEMGRQTVEAATLLYAWHSRHHVAHIQQLRHREAW